MIPSLMKQLVNHYYPKHNNQRPWTFQQYQLKSSGLLYQPLYTTYCGSMFLMKHAVTPTKLQILTRKIPAMFDYYHNRPNLAPVMVPVVRLWWSEYIGKIPMIRWYCNLGWLVLVPPSANILILFDKSRWYLYKISIHVFSHPVQNLKQGCRHDRR